MTKYQQITNRFSVKEIGEIYGLGKTTAIKYVKLFQKEVERTDSMINSKYFFHPNRRIKEVDLDAFDYFMKNFNSFQDEVQRKKLNEFKN